MRGNHALTILMAALAVSRADVGFSAGTGPDLSPEIVERLMAKDLVGVPGKEIVMLTVQYLPGGASLPHRHDAQVFVYVLDGELTMQVAGGPALTLRPGQTFYESPADVHVVSANASKTAPATILVFMVKDKNAPGPRAAGQEGAP